MIEREEGISRLEILIRSDHNKGGNGETNRLGSQEAVVGVVGKDCVCVWGGWDWRLESEWKEWPQLFSMLRN